MTGPAPEVDTGADNNVVGTVAEREEGGELDFQTEEEVVEEMGDKTAGEEDTGD